MRRLPDDAEAPTVSKADADGDPIVFVNIRSEQRSLLELSAIADNLFKARFETIAGEMLKQFREQARGGGVWEPSQRRWSGQHARSDVPQRRRQAEATDRGEARDLLESHDWPGNVRELKNAVERATLLSRGGTITPKHLPPEIVAAATAPRDTAADIGRRDGPSVVLHVGASMADAEREMIRSTLVHTRPRFCHKQADRQDRLGYGRY